VMSPLPGTVAGWSGPPWQIVVDGNRLLDILKALDAETLIVHFEPFNPRTPVGFSHTHGSVVEGLCPLLPIG